MIRRLFRRDPDPEPIAACDAADWSSYVDLARYLGQRHGSPTFGQWLVALSTTLPHAAVPTSEVGRLLDRLANELPRHSAIDLTRAAVVMVTLPPHEPADTAVLMHTRRRPGARR